MLQTEIKISGSNEMELLTRKNALQAVNELPTDQVKRVLKLIKSPKAKEYLSSELKFAILNRFL